MKNTLQYVATVPARLWSGIVGIARNIGLAGKPQFCNEGDVSGGEWANGCKTYKAAAAIATKFFCVEVGADATYAAVSNSENDIPLGIVPDEAEAADDLVEVQLFGAYRGTMKGVANAAITLGDMLVSAGNGKLKTLPTDAGTYYIIGRALNAPSAADAVVEFAPSFPIQRVVT